MKRAWKLGGVTGLAMVVVAGAAWWFFPGPGAGAETRTWTDVEGRTIEAEMIGFEHARGLVKFRLSSGRDVEFPLVKLSAADQKLIRSQPEKSPSEVAKHLDTLIAKGGAPGVKAGPLSDQQFLERAYAKLAGRAPRPEEKAAFRGDASPDKRARLTDRLIDSREFARHFVESFGGVLGLEPPGPDETAYPDCKNEEGKKRIAEQKKARKPAPPLDAYRDWLELEIQLKRPWNAMVEEMITAAGKVSENPAAGYLSANYRNEFFNPSRIFTGFLGVEITCAECHDHPYEDIYRMDFHKIAAYFGELEFESAGGNDVSLSDSGSNRATLPEDYQYNDADPGGKVSPGTYFGKVIKEENYPTARAGFADWLTDRENPRFTLNLVNRLWKHLFDTGLIEPVSNLPGHIDGKGAEMELIKALQDLMREKNYRITEFLKVVCRTEAFSGARPK